MTTGTKAQVVGKGLYLELSKTSWGDRYQQVLIIPNLPDELGRKRGHSLLFTRGVDVRYSRNSWSSPTTITTDLGILGDLSAIVQSSESDPNDESGWATYYPRVDENKVAVEASLGEELSELEKAEAHANLLLLQVAMILSRDTSDYDREGMRRDGVKGIPYPKGFSRTWSYDKVDKMFAFDITDRDMVELYNDYYKVPSALANRIKQARLRVA